jgi:hypothetical protein
MSFERDSLSLISKVQSPAFNEGADLKVELLYIRNSILDNYHIQHHQVSEKEISIFLKPSNIDLSSPSGSPTFIGKRQRFLSCSATATLVLSVHLGSSNTKNEYKKGVEAGLTVYKDPLRHASIFYSFTTQKIRFKLEKEATGESVLKETDLKAAGTKTQKIEFKIVAEKESYGFWYRNGGSVGGEWTLLYGIDTLEMTGRDFTRTVFGVFAYVDNEDVQGEIVSFEDVEL